MNQNIYTSAAYTAYEDGTDTVCSETLAHKIQALGSHPEERIQHSEYNGRIDDCLTIFA
jgi:hypothetical protein